MTVTTNPKRNYRQILYGILLFAAFIFMLHQCTAQTIGANGEGLTEKYLPADVPLINDMGHVVIAFPGGASAKYNYARLNVPGYGMRIDSIYAWNARYGKNENGEDNLQTDINDFNTDKTKPRSYLYDLAEIQQATGCDIIWKANVFADPAEVIASIHDYLSIRLPGSLSWHPHINYISLGNELYFIDFTGDGKNMDGAAALAVCIPHILALKSNFPDIPLAFNYAQDVDSRQHMLYNDPFEAYRNAHPDQISGFDTHPYGSPSNYLKESITLHPGYIAGSKSIKKIPYSATYNPQLHAAFDAYNNAWRYRKYERNLIDTIHMACPGAEIITTEFQTNPISLYSDTWSNAAYLFDAFTTYRPEIKYYCAHNLLGGYDFAMIFNHAVSAKYFALQMANELPLSFQDVPADGKIWISGPGTFYFRYVNITGSAQQVSVNYAGDYTATNTALYGTDNYSAMGTAGMYNKTPKQAVDVFYEETGSMNIKAYAFGYFKITAEAIPVYGCMNPYADNYNPAATIDNGSCFYTIYGCMDATATNYNPAANKEDGSCTYPPPPPPPVKPCVKKWWQIFKHCKK